MRKNPKKNPTFTFFLHVGLILIMAWGFVYFLKNPSDDTEPLPSIEKKSPSAQNLSDKKEEKTDKREKKNKNVLSEERNSEKQAKKGKDSEKPPEKPDSGDFSEYVKNEIPIPELPLMPFAPPPSGAENLSISHPFDWPDFHEELIGNNEIVFQNHNPYGLCIGLRRNTSGKDLIVPAGGNISAFAPQGDYSIFYHVLEKNPLLLEGNSLSIKDKSIMVVRISISRG